MQNNAVDFLMEQFNELNKMFKDTLIRSHIDPVYNKNTFTFKNKVDKGINRSPMSAKYFNSGIQYLALMKSRSYHFLFSDYSIGRFHYEFDEDNKLSSYNLLWFPCPFSDEFFDNNDLDKGDMYFLNLIDELVDDEIIHYNEMRLRTPIRIDFDINYSGNRREFHPTSHIHQQHTETRTKNTKEFCLYNFFAFIIENCYPDFYYKYRDEMVITEDMKKKSLPWLRVSKEKEKEKEKYGIKIFTSYSS